MLKESVRQWQHKISELDEHFGIKPRYPYATMKVHIENVVENQNDIIRKVNSELGDKIKESVRNVSVTIGHGFDLMIESNYENTEKLTSSIGKVSESVKDLDRSVNLGLGNLAIKLDKIASINKQGFSDIINNLQYINSTLSWGFSGLIELNRQMNTTLDQILQVLHIPNIEKERKLKIEKGLDFYQKTYYDKELYNYSKKMFEDALKMDITDYYVLYNLGIIHLFSKEHIDFETAIKYFTESARFSLLELKVSKSKVEYSDYSSSFRNNTNIKEIATYSFVYLARCYYLIGDYRNSLINIKKAYEISPLNNEVCFDKAKICCVNNKINESVKILNKIIDRDRFTSIKILNDKDLITKKEVLLLLKKKKTEIEIITKDKYAECVNLAKGKSRFNKQLKKIHNIILKDSYLDYKKAFDLL